jgi:hypothetical protein
VNLSTGTTFTYKYAKITVSIELRPKAASFYDLHGEARTKQEVIELAEYEEAVPRCLDALGSIVSAHTPDSLASADGRAKLKSELLAGMRGVLGEEEVIDIYLTDFVMQ